MLNIEHSTPPSIASFFSGIGGFDLGFERSGFHIAMQCEIDPFCNDILAKHWPTVKRYKDIREVKYADVPSSDVWVGGFPCQDVSLARMGSRTGLKGKRSSLFYEFARLIREGLPPIVVLENVAGLRNSHGGRDFQTVIHTLAELGYSVGWRVFNSKYFGVPQSRQRVYIVGCYREGRGPAEILFEPECSSGNDTSSRQNETELISTFKTSLGDFSKGPIVQGLAYCLYACSARHTGTDWSRTYVTYPQGRVRRLMPSECEGIQGFPTDWTLPIKLPDDVDKLDTLRYTALGNAVSVPAIEWLARRIQPVLQHMKTTKIIEEESSSEISLQTLRSDTLANQGLANLRV